MKRFCFFTCVALNLTFLALMLVATRTWADVPVPSRWRGEITGQVYHKTFRLPVLIEFKGSLPFENNPLNIYVGAGDPNQIGHLFLSSAMQFQTTQGFVTLQYLTVSVQGTQVTATLTNHHGAEAAKANGFSGPNASADQASSLMKGVLRDAFGAVEMFTFSLGTTLHLHVNGNHLSGMIQGAGSSCTGTSSQVDYRANLTAELVR